MLIELIRGCWYDERGNPISNNKKERICEEIRIKLDRELNKSKFEKVLKCFIFKIINK